MAAAAGCSVVGDDDSVDEVNLSNTSSASGGAGVNVLDVSTASGNVSGILSGLPVKKPPKAKWNTDEDQILREAVQRMNGKNWKLISRYLTGKTEVQCLHRWTKVLNPELTKGPWTQLEDDKLVELVRDMGPQK
jgi:transcription factor MYB, plant